MSSGNIETVLNSFEIPALGRALGEFCQLKQSSDGGIALQCSIPLAAEFECLKPALQSSLVAAGLMEEGADLSLDINVEPYRIANADRVPAGKLPPPRPLPGVKNVIAIASGKGGVGKSTTAINLALALKQGGAVVGVLDADIFGPSQSLMFGVPEGTRPQTKDNKLFIPVEAHGIQVMSMGFLMTEQTPAVWRGPMASGALQQLFNQTAWEGLDYMIVDLPPGTGDIQLTLSQSCPLTAAVIVTTPQDIALLDAIKGIEMFQKVKVPILGVIENMSTHQCSHCGHVEPIFGEGGGEKVASDYKTPLLAQLPLDMNIRKQADDGNPVVLADPDSAIAGIYRSAALKLAANLCALEVERSIPNVVSIR